MDKSYLTQVKLEEEARGVALDRIRDSLSSEEGGGLLSSALVRSFINPLVEAIDEFMEAAKAGAVGRRMTAHRLLGDAPTPILALITARTVIDRMSTPWGDYPTVTLTSLASQVGAQIHMELRTRNFATTHSHLVKRLLSDFDRRELPRYKREEYMRLAMKKVEEEWEPWTQNEMCIVGLKMVELFMNTTGAVEIQQVYRNKKRSDVVNPTKDFVDFCTKIVGELTTLASVYFPMIIPPNNWGADTLEVGGYMTEHTIPYTLVKGARRGYRRLLEEHLASGQLTPTLDAVNAIQRTPWRINTRVLDVVEQVYALDMECGGLPRANFRETDPPPPSIEGLPYDDPAVLDYRRSCALIHEENRRSVGKRVIALRAMALARRFAPYEEIYFPHSLDSRGRIYPVPSGLNPQGPDFVKGLLEFADGERLGAEGLYWLGVHGANCFGEDKLLLDERAAWAQQHLAEIRSVAADPLGDLWWTKADNPVQFLAFCFEYAEADENYVSHLHVDLDATCSGLQHFSGMLRDAVGGFHVNMTKTSARQDVYGAVAVEATHWLGKVKDDRSAMAQAWLSSGMMTRTTAKRPVMVKPYAGTRTSCGYYVDKAVQDYITDGAPVPWAKEAMFDFKRLGADAVWAAIPKVVIAADDAMRWLSAVSGLVGKSQPSVKRIEWTAPSGFPVHLRKMNREERRVKTTFNGSIYRPVLTSETDKMDSRKMRSSVPPSFVHSMDAAHLMLTINKATAQAGIRHFAVVHDSFGVHASRIPKFSRLIREAFVEMYTEHDVLAEFLASALPLIDERFHKDIPPMPVKGDLDLQDVLENEFFFS